MRKEKQIVKDFYDSFGWVESTGGSYGCNASFEDERPVLDQYYHKTLLRIRRFIKSQGQYFLDAGSGATSRSEYWEYSLDYERRICADISGKALLESRVKLGEHGLYVVSDLTHLPFKNEAFDTILCAHALYHIPHDEQASTLRELYRMLKQEGNCVVIYSWPDGLLRRTGLGFQRVVANTKHLLAQMFHSKRTKKAIDESEGDHNNPGRPPVYYYTHSYRWFRETVPDDWGTEIYCWRSVGRTFTKTFVSNNFGGSLLMELIFRLESIFPHTLARIGRFPMIMIRK